MNCPALFFCQAMALNLEDADPEMALFNDNLA